MPCEWRERDGLRYLDADYRGLQTLEQMLDLFAEQLAMLEAEGPGSRLLVHVDANHRPPSQFLDTVKHASRERLNPLGVRVAFVGISGIGRMVLRGLQLVGGGAPVVLAFPGEEQALAYLGRAG